MPRVLMRREKLQQSWKFHLRTCRQNKNNKHSVCFDRIRCSLQNRSFLKMLGAASVGSAFNDLLEPNLATVRNKMDGLFILAKHLFRCYSGFNQPILSQLRGFHAIIRPLEHLAEKVHDCADTPVMAHFRMASDPKIEAWQLD